MKPLRLKIEEACALKKTLFDVVEKDYALSYVLAGIAQQSSLTHTLVFKGGTALKKLFFGDYRFSVDLDFSTLKAPKGRTLANALTSAMQIAKIQLSHYGPLDIQIKRLSEKAPHPTGQEAFNIHVKFPWHKEPLCHIKVEITHDEPVILPPEYRPILHGYEEPLDCAVACYPIEEIIAEKLRALLQTHQKLVTRGWNRPRARDYYDLWRVLNQYGETIDSKKLKHVLIQKCRHRDVTYQTSEDFFTEALVREANQHWQATLGNLVDNLPECDSLLKDTKNLIARFI